MTELYCFDIIEKNKALESEEEKEQAEQVPTKWSRLLAQYKTNFHNKKWVFKYSEHANIIYDKYPKSLVHLLVLPFNISYNDNYRVNYANKATQFKHGHLKSLKLVHDLCRTISKQLLDTYRDTENAGFRKEEDNTYDEDNTNNTNNIDNNNNDKDNNEEKKHTINDIKIGYHIVPTMEDLHIHIISDDFVYTKNRNQRKSFYRKNFITIDEVENELSLYGRILPRDSDKKADRTDRTESKKQRKYNIFKGKFQNDYNERSNERSVSIERGNQCLNYLKCK